MRRIGRPSAAATRGLSTPIRYDSRCVVHNEGPDRAIDRPCLPFHGGRNLKYSWPSLCAVIGLGIFQARQPRNLGAPTVD